MAKFPKHKSEKCINSAHGTDCNSPLCQLGSSGRPSAEYLAPSPSPAMSHPPASGQQWVIPVNGEAQEQFRIVIIVFIQCNIDTQYIETLTSWNSKGLGCNQISSQPPILVLPCAHLWSVCAPARPVRRAGLRCPGCSNLRTKTQSIAKLPVISTSVSTLQGRYQQRNSGTTTTLTAEPRASEERPVGKSGRRFLRKLRKRTQRKECGGNRELLLWIVSQPSQQQQYNNSRSDVGDCVML